MVSAAIYSFLFFSIPLQMRSLWCRGLVRASKCVCTIFAPQLPFYCFAFLSFPCFPSVQSFWNSRECVIYLRKRMSKTCVHLALLLFLSVFSPLEALHMPAPKQLFTTSLSARRSSGGGAGAVPQAPSDGGLQSWEIGPPPDLPSLLLSNRIIYVGMPLVPSVTELVIAQLLYLNYQNDQMITMYLNSPGTNAPGGQAFSYDTEAFAIADTMQFIRPPIRTICVGQVQ